MVFDIILYRPEIPQNTGNIVRLCAVTGCRLYLIGPLGFSLRNKYLKRAGLDYWEMACLNYCDTYQELLAQHQQKRLFYVTTKGHHYYTDFDYQTGDGFVFGCESSGLPNEILESNRENLIRIPMISGARCLNLSNSVAIVLYEALRKQKFKNLS